MFPIRRFIALFVCFTFIVSTCPPVFAGEFSVRDLPVPGTMVSVSPAFEPALIRGLTVHKDNPFLFDFIVDPGQSKIPKEVLKDESLRMIKYFFAALTIPDKDIWVNLSPYEKDRMVPVSLGETAMGRDLLAQDYLLKQLTASLIYPQKALGKTFWDTVYSKAKAMYGTTQIPVNTFNKVWIVPQRVGIYEHGQTAFIVDGHLKVMLEEDYLALSKHQRQPNNPNALASQIIREIILPEIEKEINEGKNFATLRQIFYAQALAVWFKRNLKQALLNRVYANKGTVKGIDQNDAATNEAIYQQYLRAYKKGVFNYIKEDIDPVTQGTLPRKYFSGGYGGDEMDAAMYTAHLSPKAVQVVINIALGYVDVKAVAVSDNAQAATLTKNVNEADAAMINSVSKIMLRPLTPKGKKFVESFILKKRQARIQHLLPSMLTPWENDDTGLTWQDLKSVLDTKDKKYRIARQAAVNLLGSEAPAIKALISSSPNEVWETLVEHTLPNGDEDSVYNKRDSYLTLAEINIKKAIPLLIQGMSLEFKQPWQIRFGIMWYIKDNPGKFRRYKKVRNVLTQALKDDSPNIRAVARLAIKALDSAQVSSDAAMNETVESLLEGVTFISKGEDTIIRIPGEPTGLTVPIKDLDKAMMAEFLKKALIALKASIGPFWDGMILSGIADLLMNLFLIQNERVRHFIFVFSFLSAIVFKLGSNAEELESAQQELLKNDKFFNTYLVSAINSLASRSVSIDEKKAILGLLAQIKAILPPEDPRIDQIENVLKRYKDIRPDEAMVSLRLTPRQTAVLLAFILSACASDNGRFGPSVNTENQGPSAVTPQVVPPAAPVESAALPELAQQPAQQPAKDESVPLDKLILKGTILLRTNPDGTVDELKVTDVKAPPKKRDYVQMFMIDVVDSQNHKTTYAATGLKMLENNYKIRIKNQAQPSVRPVAGTSNEAMTVEEENKVIQDTANNFFLRNKIGYHGIPFRITEIRMQDVTKDYLIQQQWQLILVRRERTSSVESLVSILEKPLPLWPEERISLGKYISDVLRLEEILNQPVTLGTQKFSGGFREIVQKLRGKIVTEVGPRGISFGAIATMTFPDNSAPEDSENFYVAANALVEQFKNSELANKYKFTVNSSSRAGYFDVSISFTRNAAMITPQDVENGRRMVEEAEDYFKHNGKLELEMEENLGRLRDDWELVLSMHQRNVASLRSWSPIELEMEGLIYRIIGLGIRDAAMTREKDKVNGFNMGPKKRSVSTTSRGPSDAEMVKEALRLSNVDVPALEVKMKEKQRLMVKKINGLQLKEEDPIEVDYGVTHDVLSDEVEKGTLKGTYILSNDHELHVLIDSQTKIFYFGQFFYWQGQLILEDVRRDQAMFTRGGIDLSQQDAALRVEKDANGGVVVNVDPALIARIEREGMPEVVPVIINMQPADIRSLFGVEAKI